MAEISQDLIKRLLREEEGSCLDFKRDQYPLSKASEDEQSKLLKDILAFANAWRRSDAFIVIGVEEVKGGNHRLVGVSNHLDDASLQQFVNSKTQRPIELSYVAAKYEGVQVGFIQIPVQKRPFFLKKLFGRLDPNVVYVRRGSSTAIANPDELAEMGRVDSGLERAEPSLALQFTNPYTRSAVGSSVQLDLEVLTAPAELRAQSTPSSSRFGLGPDVLSVMRGENPKYYEELIQYLEAISNLKPLGLCLTNLSGVAARDVRVEIIGPENVPALLVGESKYPSKPSRSYINPVGLSYLGGVPDGMIAVIRHGTQRRVLAEFGTVLPKATEWSDNVFYIGATQSCQVAFKAHIYAENLSSPLVIPMEVTVTAVTRPMTEADLKRLDEIGESEESEDD